MTGLAAYGGLFLSALVAATVLPAQSEFLLAALLRSGDWSTSGLLVSASVGNVLGSVINYGLGRGAEAFRDRRWFPASAAALARAQRWYGRYGHWSLLLSWMPIIGDPITVAAGLLREPIWRFLLLVTIAKVGRYLVLMIAVLGIN
ncbi:YqaA family protein [uncultured Jannaschia sp.]|uniref:YqaA family protein n=1 Tax=uncultured Jannaschia sp. TaxID=293347 RepID=UPI00260BCD1B|nr:YqaA family protein [uncultured Jannaschia sp.]